jgi:hypothetical protein
VIGMKVTNVKGPSGEWDTLPGNGKWLLGVTRVNGEILNRTDGAINIPISEPMAFILWLEDNGSLGKAETRSKLTLVYDDGRILEEDIKPQSAPVATGGEGNFLEASLAGTGSYDYVGQGEKLSGNLNRDYRFDIRFTKTGTLTGVRLVNLTKGGEWDTIPNNSHWLLAVTRPGRGVLNAPNGSVKIPVEGTTALHLWVEDNKTLADPASKWRISLAFSDGQLLEKEIGCPHHSRGNPVDRKARTGAVEAVASLERLCRTLRPAFEKRQGRLGLHAEDQGPGNDQGPFPEEHRRAGNLGHDPCKRPMDDSCQGSRQPPAEQA